MVIKNSTICDDNVCRQAAMMINSEDVAYRRKKLIFSGVGLLSGIVAVSIMSRQLASTGDYNIWVMMPFLAVCGVCLYISMRYLDNSKCTQIKKEYAAKGITKTDYEIDSEEITIIAGDKRCVCPWSNVVKWTENNDYFYLFLDDAASGAVMKKETGCGGSADNISSVDGKFGEDKGGVEQDDVSCDAEEEQTDIGELIAGSCIIMSKKGFTQCSSRDMKQLCSAIMESRKE